MTTLILAFDTETTGSPSKSKLPNDPNQPHLVALSALQVQPANLYIQQSMSKLVVPFGWSWDDSPESPDRAFQVHRLPINYCATFGRSEKEVLDEFLALWKSPSTTILVAHNLAFDRQVIACAISRYYGACDLLDKFQSAQGFCTMSESRHIVNARTKPNAKGVTRLKMPSLAEAYEFFADQPLTGHHSANQDAVAALMIYAGIQEHAQEHAQSGEPNV